MSLKQFETFYWPSLKKMIVTMIDEGLTPCPFFEGDYTSRLEYLAELPKGKILGLFDSTDPAKAKEILGETMCISGMMPLSLLQTGTPESIKEYAKKLIDVAKDAKADAVKFQTFKAEKVVTKHADKAVGLGGSQYEVIKGLELKDRETIELNDYAQKKDIIFLSSVFSI